MTGPFRREIQHTSRYLYSNPVNYSVMSLCLQPGDIPQQRLLKFRIETDPPAPLNPEMDSFGNTKHVLTAHFEHTSLEINSFSTVETTSAPPLPDSLGADAWEAIGLWKNSFKLWEYTHPSAFARPSPALTAFIQRSGIRRGDDPLESLLRLSDTLHRSFQYLPGSTSAISPIEHILETGQGVCQDYAHLMITIARSWGIPTRYVSGYLYVADEGGEYISSRASHAWVECLLPGLDWVGLDPTNRSLTDERHVRMAVGRDYKDVTPTSGIIHGNAESSLEVDVHVRSLP